MKNLSQFKKSEDGVVAVIVAISFVSLLMAVLAFSIDLNRTQTSYAKNQNGTDAAALAAAEWVLKGKADRAGSAERNALNWAPDDDEIKEYAKRVLIENFRLDHANSTLILDPASFTVDYKTADVGGDKVEHSVEVAACTIVDTPVAASAKKSESVKTCATSTAAFVLGKLENTEVAFALDFTESMFWDGLVQSCAEGNNSCPTFNQTKAANLVDTIEYVFDTYFPKTEDSTAYASIVPYTSFVNLYPYNATMVETNSDSPTFKADPVINPDLSSQYLMFNNSNVKGPDLRNYESVSRFHHFYTAQNDDKFFKEVIDPEAGRFVRDFKTDDLTYILERVPILDKNKFEAIIGSSDTGGTKFDNYSKFINEFNHNAVPNPERHFSRSAKEGKFNTFTYKPFLRDNDGNFIRDENGRRVRGRVPIDDPNEAYRMGYCYSGMIVAAADQRIERRIGNLSTDDGVIESSGSAATEFNSGRNLELHESFPIQPLTNKHAVLQQVLGRFVSNDRLYPNESYGDAENIMNRQTILNKAADVSTLVKTQSMQGLFWAWFSVSGDQQGDWAAESLHENYCLERGNLACSSVAGSSKDSRANLPSKEGDENENQKHIVLISDGYDVDGDPELAGKFNVDDEGEETGLINACDAYTPIEKFSDDQYDALCERIEEDGITVHFIMYDFAAGADNRYKKCAETTGGLYFENVIPTGGTDASTNLQEALDTIFAGIITDIVPVKLTK